MRKSILIALLAAVVLGGIAFSGCRDGATPAPGSELNWDDMPIFAGASQVDEANWEMPPEDKDWLRVEWRYYRFDEPYTSVAEVTMFYRNEMPKNGWQENAWMDIQDTSWGAFSKNDDYDDAIIWITSKEGHTVFALMRASN